MAQKSGHANVELELKPHFGSWRQLPSNKTFEKEYSAKYLELIGVNSTADNVELLLKNLPIDEALVLPVFAREKIAIFPGIGKLCKEADIAIIMKEMYSAKSPDDDGKKKKKKRNKKRE